MAPEKKQQILEKVREVREPLRNRVGTLPPSAGLIREDRDVGH
jgi:hypothetical protein